MAAVEAPAGGGVTGGGEPTVVVRLFAVARVAAGTSSATLAGATVAAVLASARARFGPAFATVEPTCRVWVNGRPATAATPLVDGDEVALLPPVSGGADGGSVSGGADGGPLSGGADGAGSDPLDPAFLAGLDEVPVEELRRRRELANSAETQYSYLRRLVQGRLDIVEAELDRRARGGRPGDVSDLVGRLPAILGEQIHAPGLGRLPEFLAPGEVDPDFVQRLDAVVTTDELSDLPDLGQDRLDAICAELRALDREVSDPRRAVQAVVDRIKAELVRRYREGAVGIDVGP